MAFTDTTLGSLITQVARRLSDEAMTFWEEDELRLYLKDALRTWNLTAAWMRARAFVSFGEPTLYLDLSDLRTVEGVNPWPRTVTQQDVLLNVAAYLMETATATGWTGSAQFSEAQILDAIVRRRNQLLGDTGIVLSESSETGLVANEDIILLSETYLDIRHVVWRPQNGDGEYGNRYVLRRQDDQQAFALSDSNLQPAARPRGYSLLGSPPNSLRLIPPPATGGMLEILATRRIKISDFSAPVTLNLPDDLLPVLTWGVLADLLGGDGQGRDDARARFAENNYQQGVQLINLLGTVIRAEIDGRVVPLSTLSQADLHLGGWQNTTGRPRSLAIAGLNLVAPVPPVSGGDHSLLVDTWACMEIPGADNDAVQIKADIVDVIINYTTHLALFKCGGAEWAGSLPRADDLLRAAAAHNGKLLAHSHYFPALQRKGQQEEEQVPRNHLPPPDTGGQQ